MNRIYQEYRITWRGIAITLRYCPNMLAAMEAAHLEIISDGRAPLPVSETGYRSQFFLEPDPLADWQGDPVAFTLDWLDTDAKLPEWQERCQLSLF